MLHLHQQSSAWPSELDRVRQWYQPHLERRYPDAVVRAGDLHQLQRIASGYPSRGKFLTDLTLDPPSATSVEAGAPLLDEDYLILSTIHSAKGQEWKAVFILNVVDGCIPSHGNWHRRGYRGRAAPTLRCLTCIVSWVPQY
jgi:DNA helicase II / ATP-dependent DNA helicase PcrA